MSNHVVLIIESARGLKAADSNGTSDPYAVLMHDGHRLATKVQSRTLSPYWGEHFEIRADDDAVFRLRVYDSDFISPGGFQATHSIGKPKFNPMAKFRQKVKKGLSTAATGLLSKADDDLGGAEITMETILGLAKDNKTEAVLPLAPYGGEITVQFEMRTVDRTEEGQVAALDDAALPGQVPEGAAAAPAEPLASRFEVGVPDYIAIEYPIEQAIETKIVLPRGHKMRWQGRDTKDIISMAGEVCHARVIVQVKHTMAKCRAIFVKFKGIASGGSHDEKIIRIYTDILKDAVQKSDNEDLVVQDDGFVHLARGKYSFPVAIDLPAHLPTSVQSAGPTIAYTLSSELDVLHFPNAKAEREVLVVNMGTTVHGKESHAFEQEIALKMCPATVKLSADRDIVAPLEDLRLNVTVTNVSATLPIEKCDVELFSIHGTVKHKVADMEVEFRPPIKRGHTDARIFHFECPDGLPPTTSYMGISVRYELRVKADVVGRDAAVSMNLCVLVRDPFFKQPKLPIDYLANIDTDPLKWSTNDFAKWVTHGASLDPPVDKDVVGFVRDMDLNGVDLASFFDPRSVAPPDSILKESPRWPANPGVTALLTAKLRKKADPTLKLWILLKELHFTEYGHTLIEVNRMHYDDLEHATIKMLSKIVPLGVAIRVKKAFGSKSGQ